MSGRGWATLSSDGSLEGRIFLHLGEKSGFRAVRDDLDVDSADG